MALATNYINVIDLRQDLLYNEKEGEQYRPLTIRTQGVVRTTEGARRDLETRVTVGSLQSSPLTEKQIYTQLGTVTNMHTRLQNALKDFYTTAINDDISV